MGSFLLMIEACFVCGVPCFEGSGCEVYVKFRIVRGGYLSFVDNALGSAFSWEGAVILVSAIAAFWLSVWVVDDSVIVGFGDGRHIVHAAVSDFQGVSVADFP